MAVLSVVFLPRQQAYLAKWAFYAGLVVLCISFFMCWVVGRTIVDELLINNSKSLPRFAIAMLSCALVSWVFNTIRGREDE